MVTQPLSTISLLKHIVIARDVQCLKIINYVYIWLIHESVHLHIDLGQLTCILLGHISFDPHTILYIQQSRYFYFYGTQTWVIL